MMCFCKIKQKKGNIKNKCHQIFSSFFPPRGEYSFKNSFRIIQQVKTVFKKELKEL